MKNHYAVRVTRLNGIIEQELDKIFTTYAMAYQYGLTLNKSIYRYTIQNIGA